MLAGELVGVMGYVGSDVARLHYHTSPEGMEGAWRIRVSQPSPGMLLDL